MKLHFPNEWLKDQINTDPCDLSSVGILKPSGQHIDFHEDLELLLDLYDHIDQNSSKMKPQKVLLDRLSKRINQLTQSKMANDNNKMFEKYFL